MKRFCLLLIGLMTLWSCQPDDPVVLIPDDSDVENVEKPDNGETPENPDNSDDSDEAAEAAEFESREVPAVKPHTGGKIIVGYITYWEEIMPDPTLLTHINYAFGHIRSDFETFDIKTPSRLKKVVELKKENPNLKVLLSIGGWEAGNFSEMAADPVHRVKFAKNCLAAVEKYGLDGIDIDWEYPSSSSAGISSSPDDIKNFNLVIRDLRIALGSDKLVTIATYAKVKYFDLNTLNQYLDFVNIMTYDMGKPPYHNAALYPSSATKYSCDEAVEKHHQSGMPYEKLVLGIPFYGKDVSSSVNYVDLITSKYSKYNKCWDDEAMVPYLADDSGTMIMTYDDEQSVGLKAEYIKSKGLLGAMYWSIEGDDASWTLSKALASRLLPLNDDSADEELPEYLVTNTYM